MDLYVYNTLTRKKERFLPHSDDGLVRIYVCGPTVYDYSHLGHARAAVAFDVIRRYLEFLGYKVIYLNNITDIDDKIIKRAAEEGISTAELAEKFSRYYFQDMYSLGVKPANIYPRATAHITDIIMLIEKLIENGHAYVSNGSVYFDVASFKEYGKLSNLKPEDMETAVRIDIEEGKRNPQDFVLWKSAKPGEPWWPSPWGRGRPGWHIECSAMSMKYLGKQLDIHGGGQDLIFPHHENEIAQSECATKCKPFVKYWLHNGFVMVNKEKMSKSLKNFFTVREILEKFSPATVRFFLVSTHYRSPIDFSDSALEEAEKSLERLVNTRKIMEETVAGLSEGKDWSEYDNKTVKEILNIRNRFFEDMSDDFNTSGAVSRLFELSRVINRYIADGGDNYAVISTAKQLFDDADKILNIFFGAEGKYIYDDKLIADILDITLFIRNELRKNKDYQLSDIIRDKLSDIGIMLEDKPDKTVWYLRRDRRSAKK